MEKNSRKSWAGGERVEARVLEREKEFEPI